MKIPKGQENKPALYAPERHVIWERRKSKYKCVACGRQIEWVYRSGVLWESNRYYCAKDRCQRIRVYRTAKQEELIINRPGFAN